MKPIRCHHFEARLDEWASGTLPDFERGAMAEHEAACPSCRELAEAAREVIGAARAEELRLPGDAYFREFRTQLEDEMAFLRQLVRTHRPAPLLSQGQVAGAVAALLCSVVFVLSLPLPAPARSAEPVPQQTLLTGKSLTIRDLRHYNARLAETYQLTANTL